MFLSGNNRNTQLDSKKTDYIFPPLKSHLNVSSLLSFSVAHYFSVWVDKNNDAHSSRYNQIIIKNKDGQQCKFVSAVCGANYTLYLAFGQAKNDNYQLIYDTGNEHVFLNVGNRNPKALFGGYKQSAAIDSEGGILIINPNEALIEPVFLPGKDKAINVACCDSFYIALGISGRVYLYVIEESKNPVFSPIDELKDEKINDISGTTEHCFFVTNKGKVYGYGSNIFHRLGIENASARFCPIDTLNKYKIIAAFAGFDHSLFITSEGESLACGYNDYAQTLVFQEPHREKVRPPVILPYEGKAKFFVLGYGITVALIDCQIPANMPNKIISNTNRKIRIPEVKRSEIVTDSEDENLEQAKKEIKKLLQIQEELKQKIRELEKIQLQQQKELNKYKQNSSEGQKELEIMNVSDLKKFQTIKKIGHGSIADVFEVTRQEHYVMKVFEMQFCKCEDKDDDDDDDEAEIDFNKMKKFFREYEILNQLDHPNILKTYGFCFGDKTQLPVIIFEYCPSNLKKKIKKLADDDKISIIIEICSAMKQIHSLGIIHRNLKLENILLDANNHAKISDFGNSTLINPSESMTLTQMTGTLNYMAPELINGSTDYNEKVDVYAFGVLLFLILNHGEFPKIGFVDIGNGKKAEIPNSISSFSKNLINKCWSFKPDDRPSFEEIYETINGNKSKLI